MSGEGISLKTNGATVPFATETAEAAFERGRAKLSEQQPDPMVSSDGGLRVTVDDDGNVFFDQVAPAIHRREGPSNFDENLAETLDDGTLSQIATEYIEGVNADIQSRSEFIANYNRGIDLLGLKIEDAASGRGSRQSISRSKHPALLKACVRSQSMARGQMLPAQGPVRIQTIGSSTGSEDELAQDFQADFNYFFTDVMKGYYSDTDRALFYRAFGGTMYKKIYRCPIRRMPMSESVMLDSLIVSENATDLANAIRKTNEIEVTPLMMKRMQLRGGWRDVDLSPPQQANNPARQKAKQSAGLRAITTRLQDMSHTVYEGYFYLDPEDYGFSERRAPSGYPLPYKVVIDRDSQKILALHRNWKPNDEDFKERQVFVKFGLVPGLGFLDYGFLHLIGNQTRVLTAIWQILIDKGMLANFPGGMKVKGVRTATNEINPNMGEFVDVEIGTMDDIRKAIMGMPYGDISAGLVELLKIVEADVEQLSGTVEIEAGSQRGNVPVGTILAMVEQQTQDLSAVHQRDHRAQKEELCLIRDLFMDNPQDLHWLQRKGSNQPWQELIAEINDMDLVPASDPNVPSQAHRIMLNQFLMQVAQAAPMLFGSNLRTVAQRVLTSVGIADSDSLLASPEEVAQNMQNMGGGHGGAGQAQVQKAQIEMPLKQQELQLKAGDLQIEQHKLALAQAENQREAANEAAQNEQRSQDRTAEAALDAAKLQNERAKLQSDTQSQAVLDEANLRRINAQAFSAMGSGAAGFAKAAESVQQGEQDLAGLDQQMEAAPLRKRGGRRKKGGIAEGSQ